MRPTTASILSQRPAGAYQPTQMPDWKPANTRSESLARQELSTTEHVPDELILGVENFGLLSQSLGAASVEQFSLGENKDIVRLKLPSGTDLAQALAAAREAPGVAYAEPNLVIALDDSQESRIQPSSADGKSKPNDLSDALWGLHNVEHPQADIDAVEAWDITTGSRDGALIAVLDSGADYMHPDLEANIAVNELEIPGDGRDNDGNGVVDDVFGYNAFEGHGDPMDGMGHGTHCTGTIAAVGNNDQGIVGVNWEAKVLPVKIFHDRGLTTTDAILRGIEYANKRGAAITSNSWGGPSFSQAIHDAFAASPALHFAAAGNDGQNTDEKPSYPANYDLPNMISVGASNREDSPSWFSNRGRETVDLFAPGEEILSTLPGGGYGEKSGTSMATPHAAGVGGLVKARFPNSGAGEVRDRLLFGSEPNQQMADISVMGGRLNAARALSEDSIAPSAPNDFWPTQVSARGARFSWTNTGDDGWKNGPATGFEVRVSPEPITSENWNQASPLSTPRGEEVGDHLHAHYSQTPRAQKTSVYAAFMAVDEAGNRSELLTTRADMPASPVFFSDDMEAEETTWTANSRWSRVEVEGKGKVWTTLRGDRAGETFSELKSPAIDLRESTDSFLRFESRQDFSWSNNVFVELSEDGGKEWQRLGQLEDRGEWKEREYDLSAFDGKSVQVRIRAENLGAKEGDGMSLDNFVVLGRRDENLLLRS